MQNLNGLKISICQMEVVPGRPDINAAYIISEIESAKQRGVDIIAFPEMCTTGYLIGDKFEDSYFIGDVLSWNEKIVAATRGITAIFGTVTVSEGRGEDGRQRKHNSAIIAVNGKVIRINFKSLHPSYRFFHDSKHFFPLRKVAEEQSELHRASRGRVGKAYANLNDYLEPVPVKVGARTIKIGVILCEDMWDIDYAFSPTRTLAKKGAQIIFNLSASPWTWQKNRKRHEVVKDLLSECKVPFVYVNNTGVQNTGKNIIVFDGSSAIYNQNGDIVFEVPPYKSGSHDILLSHKLLSTPRVDFGLNKEHEGTYRSKTLPNDTEELYSAMVCATKSMVPPDKKVIIGLSGGIDSATVAAHMVDVLGKERVICVNLPFRDLNSQKTRGFAQRIAENLGTRYIIHPIDDIVFAIAGSDIGPGEFEYENIQAIARMAALNKFAKTHHGYFTCNSNKDEVAFGYGTLYGDIAGFYAPLGDLVKREVRQIADYINRERFKREVIPSECINQTPTAELSANQNDPFDYGDLNRRGYHDEMVRAYTEFRKNPEWFLEMYINGALEHELKLEKGTLKKLFPTGEDFVRDLRHWWEKFDNSFFKRVQCPPIPIFSKRAFGRDLEESLMQPHFTKEFLRLESLLIKAKTRRIAVFGSALNPPGIHHQHIVECLAENFDTVVIVPSGSRDEKVSLSYISPKHRREMTLLAFSGLKNVIIDFHDLDNGVFTPTYRLFERYSDAFKDSEIWFAVGGDLVSGGQSGNSEIQREWINGAEIWEKLNYALINHPDFQIDSRDAPPRHKIININVKGISGRSATIRERLAKNKSITGLVTPEVEKYIKKNNLYASSLKLVNK